MTAADAPTLVATEDGKPGCPREVWYDGVYGPYRCGFDQLGKCHQHGTFEVVPVEDWAPSDDVEKLEGHQPAKDGEAL